jgi:hypothetical protein
VIRFSLTCSSAHEFEGWFKNNDGFEEQAANGVLACPICGDREVRKAIMAPAIARSNGPAAPTGEGSEQERAKNAFKFLRAVRTYVESNFDHVGERFPDEARKMHLGEIEHRGIYGEASKEQVKELLDEGVSIQPVPMVPKLDG